MEGGDGGWKEMNIIAGGLLLMVFFPTISPFRELRDVNKFAARVDTPHAVRAVGRIVFVLGNRARLPAHLVPHPVFLFHGKVAPEGVARKTAIVTTKRVRRDAVHGADTGGLRRRRRRRRCGCSGIGGDQLWY